MKCFKIGFKIGCYVQMRYYRVPIFDDPALSVQGL